MSRINLISSITEISQQLEKGLFSASELCQLCWKRIATTKYLNAFVTVTNDLLQKHAEDADKRIKSGTKLGILDGIPVAIKDNFNTKHIKTTCASKMLSNYIPPFNATVVQKLLNQGSALIGKTNMDEFAMGSATVDSLFGPTKNPWRSGLKYKLLRQSKQLWKQGNHEKITLQQKTLPNDDFFVCGGSSGGSAVAVATGTCFGAIASDTGGSTRNPAALCGIVGLKPTYGLVSRHGLIPLCNSMDTPSVLARNVDDAALLLNTIAGHDTMDATTINRTNATNTSPDSISIRGLHIGIPKEYKCLGMSSEVLELWDHIASIFSNAGAHVTPVSLPHTEYSIVCYSVLCCCDVASNFARYDGIRYGHRADIDTSTEALIAASRREGFGEVVRGRILAGNYFLLKRNYKQYFIKAAQIRRLICQDFRKVFESGVDLLLTPVTLSDATPYSIWIQKSNREHNAVDDFCTQPVNMAGLPAISVPCKLSQNGLPLSLQLIGKSFQERTMLNAAKFLEQQMDFPLLDICDETIS